MTKEQADREAFEKWYLLEIDKDASNIMWQDTDNYDDSDMQFAWRGWQAATTASQPEIDELEAQIAILDKMVYDRDDRIAQMEREREETLPQKIPSPEQIFDVLYAMRLAPRHQLEAAAKDVWIMLPKAPA